MSQCGFTATAKPVFNASIYISSRQMFLQKLVQYYSTSFVVQDEEASLSIYFRNH